MKRGLFLIIGAVLAITAAHAEEQNFWKTTELTFEDLKGFLNQERCYANENNFLGCIEAVNYVFGLQQKILSTDSLAKLSDRGEVASSIEGLELRKLKQVFPSEESDGYKKYVENKNKEQRISNQVWKDFFKAHSQINFENIVNEATSNLKPQFLEETVGTAMNTFYQNAFDPHTHLSPTKEIEAEMNDTAENSYVGVGMMVFSSRDKSVELSPMDDSPAIRAGIRNNDKLISVDGVSASGDANAAIGKITGKPGTTVEIQVERNHKILSFKIQRAQISNPSLKAQLMVDSSGGTVGYIRVRDFMTEGLCKNFYKEARSLQKQKAHTLIIDLRDNGGGLVNEAICMAGLFTPANMTLLTSRNPETNVLIDTYKAKVPPILFNAYRTEVVVLMNGNSASASEILAGILQDTHRGVIVGEQSFGKGTMQIIDEWTEGPEHAQDKVAFMKTQARFHLPSGRSNQLVGLDPDFLVYSNPEPTEDDKTFLGREKDQFTNPVIPNNVPYQKDQKLISQVINCIDKRNNLITKYKTQVEDSALAPDYQLLFAEEVGFCLPRISNDDMKSALKIKVDDLSKGLVQNN